MMIRESGLLFWATLYITVGYTVTYWLSHLMLCPADYSNLMIYQQSMSTAFKKKAYITH